MADELDVALAPVLSGGTLVVLTGAGISVESGIPTFRGEQGYWKVGSRNYQPQELATEAAFSQIPRELWRWYLFRRAVCRDAAPNDGHAALVKIEAALGDRFTLITQNVDGLHRRAGSSDPLEIHGNIDFMRCAKRCTMNTYAMDEDLRIDTRASPLPDALWDRLVCPDCGGRARPHVLWFDELYEEVLFRSASAYDRAAATNVLIVVGTSGATSLPIRIGTHCALRGVPMIDINPEPNPFGELAQRSGHGLEIRASSGAALTTIADRLVSA